MNKSNISALILAALASGCSNTDNNTQKSGSTPVPQINNPYILVCETPVVQYKVRRGDNLVKIMEEELKSDKNGCLVQGSSPMLDDEGLVEVNGYRRGEYHIAEIVKMLNPPKNEKERDYRTRWGGGFRNFNLIAGETIKFPDFNGDKKIGQRSGAQAGTLQAYGNRCEKHYLVLAEDQSKKIGSSSVVGSTALEQPCR